VDPLEVTGKFGPDPIRYYLLKEVPLDRDGDFTWDLFIERYNTELANDLGNLVSRTVTMAARYFEGALPAKTSLAADGPDGELRATAERALADYRTAFEAFHVDDAIAAAWTLVRRANQYIEETQPFKLAKDPAQHARLGDVLNALLESVRISALLLTPIMPRLCARIRAAIRCATPEEALSLDQARWDPEAFRPAGALAKPEPLVPRIDTSAAG
jgi:methionyl-tRNA synthetase